MIFTRCLDRAFHRFGAGIGEKHEIGETHGHEAFGKTLLLADAVEIRGVPELIGLALEGFDEGRVAMAQPTHRDAGAKIEIALARCGS